MWDDTCPGEEPSCQFCSLPRQQWTRSYLIKTTIFIFIHPKLKLRNTFFFFIYFGSKPCLISILIKINTRAHDDHIIFGRQIVLHDFCQFRCMQNKKKKIHSSHEIWLFVTRNWLNRQRYRIQHGYAPPHCHFSFGVGCDYLFTQYSTASFPIIMTLLAMCTQRDANYRSFSELAEAGQHYGTNVRLCSFDEVHFLVGNISRNSIANCCLVWDCWAMAAKKAQVFESNRSKLTFF